MLTQIMIGVALICLSIFAAVAFFAVASTILARLDGWLQSGLRRLRMMVTLSCVILWMLAALSVAIWLWAIAFLLLGEFDSIEESVYFSMVSFTTLGFGDIVISKDWRLLSGMLAANGFLLFSLATAFLIEFLTRIRDVQLGRYASDR